MINENIGPTQLSKIYKNSTIRIKDLDSTSSRSLHSCAEAIAQVAKGKWLHGVVQACRLGS